MNINEEAEKKKKGEEERKKVEEFKNLIRQDVIVSLDYIKYKNFLVQLIYKYQN